VRRIVEKLSYNLEIYLMAQASMESIDAIQKTMFSDALHVRAQQKSSRFRPICEVQKMVGDIWAYDGLGTVEARKLLGRFNKTVFSDIEHNRRKITRDRFEITIPIDEYDVAGAVMDPKGKYADAILNAMERQVDATVQGAALASILVGREMTTSMTGATDGVLTVNATSGLTQAKVLSIIQNFIDGEVPEDKSLNLAINAEESTYILQQNYATNRDFTNNMQLDNGRVKNLMGLNCIIFGANASRVILNVTAGVRQCLAIAQGGIVIGLSKDWAIDISKRNDYVDTWQIQVTGSIGAGRTEGKLVQEVDTTV
jgi:hypothetical protein